MGTKILQGDLHIKGKLWQNGKEVNVLLTDYTNISANGVVVTSIADAKTTTIKVLKEVTGKRLKEAKDFLDSIEIGTDLTTHSYDGWQLTSEQISEFVTKATEQNLMTFAIGGAAITCPLKTITITEGKKSMIFNNTTEIVLEDSSVEVKRFI